MLVLLAHKSRQACFSSIMTSLGLHTWSWWTLTSSTSRFSTSWTSSRAWWTASAQNVGQRSFWPWPVEYVLCDSYTGTPCITDCVMAELEKLGSKFRVAQRIAKDPRFDRLPCTHKGTYADDCLVNRVTQVKNKYYIPISINLLICLAIGKF